MSEDDAPAAAKCSRRFMTASYSTISGTESSNSKRLLKAARTIRREAPALLRRPATITSVSKTTRTLEISYIAGDIASTRRRVTTASIPRAGGREMRVAFFVRGRERGVASGRFDSLQGRHRASLQNRGRAPAELLVIWEGNLEGMLDLFADDGAFIAKGREREVVSTGTQGTAQDVRAGDRGSFAPPIHP